MANSADELRDWPTGTRFTVAGGRYEKIKNGSGKYEFHVINTVTKDRELLELRGGAKVTLTRLGNNPSEILSWSNRGWKFVR